MDARLRVLSTYKLLNNAQYFRLRLCLEGIATGVAAGVIISGFRFALIEGAALREKLLADLFAGGFTASAVLLWLGALLVIAFVLTWLKNAEPQAAGSGIPQVKGAIAGVFKLRWLRILLVKFAACAIAIGSGLSLGRAGPSIQMGAVAGQGVSRLLARPRVEERYLLSGGAAAGLAAVFNAPLTGVIFVLEELNHNFSGLLLFPALSASLAATLVSRIMLGRDTVFDFSGLPLMQVGDFWVILAAGFICGVLGLFFNAGLLGSNRIYQTGILKNAYLSNFLLLVITGAVGFYLPQALGGGDDLLTDIAFNSYPLTVLLLFLAAKVVLTLLAFGSGLPGGAFIPTLVTGGLVGSVAAAVFTQLGFLGAAYKANIIVICMAAFFTASVRTPITATVLVMEMTGSFLHLLPLALASLTAFATTEIWRAKPLYGELLLRLLNSSKTPDRSAEQERSIIELTVATGSTADGRLIREISWPCHTLLVDVKRGDEELIPEGNTRLHSGDTLYILGYATELDDLEKLVGK